MYQCKKCNSSEMILQIKSTNTGLYCRKCGAWQKWLSREEIRTAHFNKIPVYDGEIPKEKTLLKKDDNEIQTKTVHTPPGSIEELFSSSGPFEEDNVKDVKKTIQSMKKATNNEKISITLEVTPSQAEELLKLTELLNKELKLKLEK